MSSFFTFLLFLLVSSFSSFRATEVEDALRECGNLHRKDMHIIVDAYAEYSNNKCTLSCYSGTKTLSTNSLNEGYVCDPVSQRKCHNGQCSGSTAEAVHECGNWHQINLTQYQTNGTEYSADQCTLKCVIDGKVASVNPVNEGLACSSLTGAAPSGAVHNGVCRKGSCVLDSTKNLTVTTIATTVPTTKPTTIPTKETTINTPTPAPIDPNAYKIDNITFIIKEAILKDTLSSADIVYISTYNCRTEAIHHKTSKLVWNQNCLWADYLSENNYNVFSLYVNNLERAHSNVYVYALFRNHHLAQPNSVAQNKLEFEKKIAFSNADSKRFWGYLYVNFTINFHKI